MTRVIESLHEYVCFDFEVRFWQAEAKPDDEYPNLSQTVLESWLADTAHRTWEAVDVAMFLADLPYCNAVQVRKLQPREGTPPAVLIYPDWP